MKVTDEMVGRACSVEPNIGEVRLRRVLETALAGEPEPGATIIELNKRVRALQVRLEKARKAGFADDGDD